MDKMYLRNLLIGVKEGSLDIDMALNQLKTLPFEDLGFAKLDHHRNIRNGFPEVVFCQGKTHRQIVEILERLSRFNNNILATRATREVFDLFCGESPDAEYHELARCITIKKTPIKARGSRLLVISAGTADLSVAEEAAVSAEVMGNSVTRLFDVGVAGIHRLLNHRELIAQASVIIVVAGMEGALASVVGGLVDVPVIAVPTSIGYGASFNGLAALLAMLNSCASGIAVVNIDNGFGAAAMANSIIRLVEKHQAPE